MYVLSKMYDYSLPKYIYCFINTTKLEISLKSSAGFFSGCKEAMTSCGEKETQKKLKPNNLVLVDRKRNAENTAPRKEQTYLLPRLCTVISK